MYGARESPKIALIFLDVWLFTGSLPTRIHRLAGTMSHLLAVV